MAEKISDQRGPIKALKDSCEAAAYLSAAIEGGDRALFLEALRDVAAARGITAVAEKANLRRESLYHMLSSKGNPEIKSLLTILRALGLKITVEAETDCRTAA